MNRKAMAEACMNRKAMAEHLLLLCWPWPCMVASRPHASSCVLAGVLGHHHGPERWATFMAQKSALAQKRAHYHGPEKRGVLGHHHGPEKRSWASNCPLHVCDIRIDEMPHSNHLAARKGPLAIFKARANMNPQMLSTRFSTRASYGAMEQFIESPPSSATSVDLCRSGR